MNMPLYVNGREFFLSFSIGASIYPLDGQDTVTLLRNADSAMQRTKQQGGNGFRFYSGDMNWRAEERLSMENHLRHALGHGEMQLYYQPQVAVDTRRIIGMEALVRWRHPQRGLTSPAMFIPLAEETGIILALGQWILREACAQHKAWQNRGLHGATMAVNISARQFHQQDLPELIQTVLDETGMDPGDLELEITESITMQDVARTVDKLRCMKEMGIKISIDDFGTGFSSLSYLKRFPIDKLKIDQSFIHNLTTDADDAAITHAVISLGHSLRLRVIAEGVETEEQYARLAKAGCDEIQGYLFSQPVPAEKLERLLGLDGRSVIN